MDHYVAQLAHQRDHTGYVLDGRPNKFCIQCVVDQPESTDIELHAAKRRFTWAVPIGAALDCISTTRCGL